jgi:hypothetical protein
VTEPSKACTKCKEVKPFSQYHNEKVRKDGKHPYCKPCAAEARAKRKKLKPVSREKAREYTARYKEKYPERVAEQDRRRNLRQKFGISLEDYDALIESQGGVCAICGQPETARNPKGEAKPLAVDHDHGTGAVRGALCARCNTAIGLMQDDVERLASAIEYLSKSEQANLEVAA